MTPSKLAIPDDVALRARLDREHEGASHVQACQYALKLAAHILSLIEYQDEGTVKEGFLLNEQWQQGKVCMADVRRASFMIHKLAKASDKAVVATALRVAGHAVAAAHVKQHAMVASDYAVKVIALLHRDAMEAVRQERLWQISQLQEIKSPLPPPTPLPLPTGHPALRFFPFPRVFFFNVREAVFMLFNVVFPSFLARRRRGRWFGAKRWVRGAVFVGSGGVESVKTGRTGL